MTLTDPYRFSGAQGGFGIPTPMSGSQISPMTRNAYLFNAANPMRYIDAIGAYTVVKDDSLWKIAQNFTGYGDNWPIIYDLNREVIGGKPNLIVPGQELYLPWENEDGTPIEGGDDWGIEIAPDGTVIIPPPIRSNINQVCSIGLLNGWLPQALSTWCSEYLAGGGTPSANDPSSATRICWGRVCQDSVTTRPYTENWNNYPTLTKQFLSFAPEAFADLPSSCVIETAH